MPRRVRAAIPLGVLVLICAGPARPWGPAGHHIIAIIAEQQVSPGVREKIQTLLMDGRYSMQDISTCADQLRSASRAGGVAGDELCQVIAGDVPATNGTWHYIQIPVPTKAK